MQCRSCIRDKVAIGVARRDAAPTHPALAEIPQNQHDAAQPSAQHEHEIEEPKLQSRKLDKGVLLQAELAAKCER